MTNIGPTPRDRSTYMMEHIPHGEFVQGGAVLHKLWRFPPEGGQVLVARVQCGVVMYRATPSISWYVSAPVPHPHGEPLVVAMRAFDTEGDAMDALLRLEALGCDGVLPADLRDAI